MLAIRTQVKEDLDCATSEIVFGTQLRLPGEFFEQNRNQTVPISKFVATQQNFLSKFKYRESRFQTNQKTYVDPKLSRCKFVFIRNDATRSPLQPTYDGPYKVLQRTPKYFKVLRNSREYTVSVDRLKSANLLSDFECQNEIKMTKRPSISGDDNHYAP